MATGSLPAANATTTSNTTHAERERYIERQLNATRRQVKIVELTAAGVTLLVGMLVFFFTAALIDHWLWPLGFWGRASALVMLVAGVAWFFAAVIWPLLRNSINPAYAALTIEHSSPSLKNSLINFLMLRSQRGDVHEVVYEAVEARAASDLSQVPLDSVIDYSKLIKIGYVLAGVFAICAAYKILSPKDPLQTMARVALPWADISRPSRVQIEEVTPGDAPKYFGDTVEIAATIRGVRAGDRVQVVYSTLDGQTVDKQLDMLVDETGRIYQAKLPADGQGLVQDLNYRIEAGDAVSRDYHLQVQAAPTIVVHKLQYDYPRYTNKPPLVVEQTGDIRALEGTKVTLHAKANQPILAAYVEFDPTDESNSPEATLRRQRVQLDAQGMEATGSFVLELAGDRMTSKFGSYHVTFMTEGGHAGQHPALHTIDVIRDLPPEVEILTPTEQTVTVPVNGEQVIEVRAVDADYALSRVSLKLTRGAAELAEEILLNSPPGHVGQSVTKFKFRPTAYNLQAGDEVVLWAVAADNRTAAKSQVVEPNTERTKNYIIKIAAADPNAQTTKDENNSGDQPPMPGDKQDQNPDKNPDKNPGQGNNPNQQPNDQANNPNDKPQPGDKNQGDKNQGDNKNPDDKQPNKNDKNDMGEGGNSPDKQNGTGGKSDKPMEGGDEPGDKQTGDNKEPGEQGKTGDKPNMNESPMEGGTEPKNPGDNKNPNQNNDANDQPMSGGNQSPMKNGQDKKEQKNQPNNNTNQENTDATDQAEEGATNGQKGSQGGKADTPMTGGNGPSQSNNDKPATGGTGQGSEPGGKSPAGNDPGAERGQPNGSPTGDKQQGTSGGKPEQGKAPGAQEQGRREQVPPGEREEPHDGEAFEKALERLMKAAKEDAQNGKTDQPQPEGTRSQDEPIDPKLLERAREFLKKQEQKEKGGDQPTPESLKDSAQGGNQQDAPSGDSETGDKPNDQQPMGTGADKKQGSGASNERGQGETGKPDDKANTKPEERGGQDSQNKEKRQGGMGTNGQSGSGRESEDKTGATEAQEANKDRAKEQRPNEQNAPDKSEAQSPSGSKKQSDSTSNTGGDLSGGGKKGGGQGGNAPGHDKAGSNSVADEGAGAASEQGQGDTGKKGGDQQKTDQQTGKSGQERGAGSSTQKDPRGNKSGKNDESNNDPMNGTPPDGQPGQPPQGSTGGDRSGGKGPVNGGGLPGEQDGDSPLNDAPVPPAEKAKIDYARQATDLVIDYLKDQKEQPDQELLNELGWTPEDLKQFLSRWETAKREAASDKKSEQELNEALRSLGLRPQNDTLRRAETKSDNQRGLGDVGPTSGPPSKYLEQFKAFKKGAARGK